MRWRGGRASRNVIDRRGAGPIRTGGRGARMGGGGVRLGGAGGLGLIGIVVVAWLLGFDLTPLLGGQTTTGYVPGGYSQPLTEADEERGEFSAVVLGLTEDVWGPVFQEQVGRGYEPPELVLYAGATGTACGYGEAATGPFYCPADSRIYLDTDFFVTLDRQLGAGGDFAAAYVIAHEVGHHVQNLLGVLPQVSAAQRGAGQAEANALQVRVELQADCFAGLWARGAQRSFGVLEPGDIDEALNAAARIGDDTLQREATGVVRPESFTHGTSAQRARWFQTGYETGSVEACDTFAASSL